jgi:thiamine kinase-like enzyme
VRPCHEDPGPLVDQLAASPQTFLHGDWKMGNLGSHADGRTILLDWAYPGRGPAALELTWYLALNAARLPERKDDAIAAYRAALEQRGVDTRGWWDQQLAASIVAIMVMFGWEKAVGGDDELAWWEARVVDCAGRLA